jgi:hypothetical protein
MNERKKERKKVTRTRWSCSRKSLQFFTSTIFGDRLLRVRVAGADSTSLSDKQVESVNFNYSNCFSDELMDASPFEHYRQCFRRVSAEVFE